MIHLYEIIVLDGKNEVGNQDCCGRSYPECFHFVQQIWKKYASPKTQIRIH